MEICRACLLTQQDMVALDEFCVTSYNLLTNLQVIIGDDRPQYFCQNCYNMVKVFTDFREQAIKSETSLREITENTKPDNLFDDGKSGDNRNIIIETCNSDNDRSDCETFDDALFSAEEYDKPCKNDLDINYQFLQCGLCKGEFVDNISFLDHLKQHKRGGKCKICFETVKITELYAHTLAHLPPMQTVEHDSKLKHEIKLETPDIDLATPTELKVETVKKEVRKTKSATKFKKKSKLSVESAAEVLLSCGLCKIIFDCKKLLLKHLDTHKVEGTSSCKLCHETFSSWPQLFGHRMFHLPKTQRHCHMCNQKYMTPSAMEFHYKTLHYDGEDKLLKCKKCPMSFPNPRKLSRHVNNRHRKKIYKYICDFCAKRCQYKRELRIHMATHLEVKPYLCDMCGFSTKIKDGLRLHKLRKHDPRCMTCKKCCMVFVDRDKLDKHNLTCYPNGAVCSECGKKFPSRSRLNSHLRSHKTEPGYKCPRCPAAYRTPSGLRIHLNKHDGNPKQRCEFCDRRFYYPSVLYKHRRLHTGERPFVCKICQKGFTARHNLKLHMRVHGEDLIEKKNKTPQEPSPFAAINQSLK